MREKKKFQTVDEYIKTFPEDVQIILEKKGKQYEKWLLKLQRQLAMGFPLSNSKAEIWYISQLGRIISDSILCHQLLKHSKKNCQSTSKEKVPYNSHWTNLFHMTWSKRLLFFELEKACLLCNLLNP